MRSLIIFMVIALAAGCSQSGNSGDEHTSTWGLSDESADFYTTAKEPLQASSTQAPVKVADEIDKKVIKTAFLNIQVENLDSTKLTIEAALPGFGAYVAQSDQSNYGGNTKVNMTLRVPPEALDPLLSFIEAQAAYLHSKEVTSKDVTEEFVDVQSRLENKRRVEQRYRDILTRASTIEEILKVEQHLGKVTEEIESAEGRLRYLSSKTALSTVKLTFYQPNYLPAEAPGQSYFSKLGASFTAGWKFLQKLILALVRVWPLILILLTIIWLIKRRVDAQNRQKAM